MDFHSKLKRNKIREGVWNNKMPRPSGSENVMSISW